MIERKHNSKLTPVMRGYDLAMKRQIWRICEMLPIFARGSLIMNRLRCKFISVIAILITLFSYSVSANWLGFFKTHPDVIKQRVDPSTKDIALDVEVTITKPRAHQLYLEFMHKSMRSDELLYLLGDISGGHGNLEKGVVIPVRVLIERIDGSHRITLFDDTVETMGRSAFGSASTDRRLVKHIRYSIGVYHVRVEFMQDTPRVSGIETYVILGHGPGKD